MTRRKLDVRLIAGLALGATSLAFLAIYLHAKPASATRPDPPKVVSCAPMSYAARLAKDEIKDNASPEVGGMGQYHYTLPYPDVPEEDKELMHPTVALWTPHGRLLGSDRGEFGGELGLLTREGNNERYEYLFASNIEDLFVMPYGIVATTGYQHMDFDFGSILKIDFSADGTPSAHEIHKLAGAVRSSWVTVDDRLLVNTGKGSFLLIDQDTLVPVRCRRHWWQRRWHPS